MNWIPNSIHFLFIAGTITLSHTMLFSSVSIIPALIICFIWSFLTPAKWRKAFAACYVLFIAIGYKYYTADLFATMNALVQPLSRVNIYLTPLPDITVPLFYDGLFFSSIALLLTTTLSFALHHKNSRAVILTAFILWGLQLLFSVQPSILLNSMYFSIVLMTLLALKNKETSHWKMVVALPLLFITVMLSVTFVIDTPQKDAQSEQLATAMTNKIADWRYTNGQPPTLSDGQLLRVSTFQPVDKAALKIVMEQPAPLYLKGFVGAQYLESAWQQHIDLAGKPLLDALHTNNFTSSTQLSLAAEASLGEQTSANMTIQNIGASSRYFYTPYELTQLKAATRDNYTMLETAPFFGERTYQFTYMQTAVNDYPKIASAVYALEQSPYLNYESYYNTYVYDTFLQLPGDTRALLLSHVGEAFTEVKDVSYEQAIEAVTGALDELLQYNVTITPTEGNDFLMSLLEETREGYSIHYATVGTLLFRTLGIPARYVEGYLVTPDDIQGAKSYSEIAINEKNAHAWTEIYIDFVGWIPVELTPPYKDVMPPVNVTDYPKAAPKKNDAQTTASASAEGQAQQVQADEDVPNTAEPLNKTVFSFLYIFIGLVLLLLLVVLYYIYKLLKAKKRQQQLDYREGVISSFTRLLNMLNNEGLFIELRVTDLPSSVATQIAPNLEEAMQLAVESYQKAMYSPKALTKREQESVQKLYQTIRQLLAQSKKRRVKWAFLWRYYIKAYFIIK